MVKVVRVEIVKEDGLRQGRVELKISREVERPRPVMEGSGFRPAGRADPADRAPDRDNACGFADAGGALINLPAELTHPNPRGRLQPVFLDRDELAGGVPEKG